MNGLTLSRNVLAAAVAEQPPAPTAAAPLAEPAVQDLARSPGTLLHSLAAQPRTLPDTALTQASAFETSTRRTFSRPGSEDRLSQLRALLEALKTCQSDLKNRLITAHENTLALQEAAQKIRSELAAGNPIPPALREILGAFGLLGMMAGLPVVGPILGLFGISMGVSTAYKKQALQIAAELDRQAAEQTNGAEAMQGELDDVMRKIASLEEQISSEVARQEKAARPAQELAAGHGVMVQDGAWVRSSADRTAMTSSTAGTDSAWAMLRTAPLRRG